MLSLSNIGFSAQALGSSLGMLGVSEAGTVLIADTMAYNPFTHIPNVTASLQQSAGRFAAHHMIFWKGRDPVVRGGASIRVGAVENMSLGGMFCAPPPAGSSQGAPPAPPGGSAGGDGDGDGDDWIRRWKGRFRKVAGSSGSEVQGRTLRYIETQVSGLPSELRRASLSGMLNVYKRFVGKKEPWTYTMDWFDWSVRYYKSAVESLDGLLATLDPKVSSISTLRSQVIEKLSKVRLYSQSKGYRHRAHNRDVGRLLWKLMRQDDVRGTDLIAFFRHMNNVSEANWERIVGAYTPTDLNEALPKARSIAFGSRDLQLREKVWDVIEKTRTYPSPSKAVAGVMCYSTKAQVEILATLFEEGYDVVPHTGHILSKLRGYYETENDKSAGSNSLPDTIVDEMLEFFALRIIEGRLSPSLWGQMVYGRTRYLIQANEVLETLLSGIAVEDVGRIRSAVLAALFDEDVKYKRLRGRVYTLFRSYGG
ncbi:MAG: hypothetical protein HN337_03590 [Deltaproteobacteria bacterium]|jgi:hypothetical protein|nr:hypothetical protein [Deltaproteobacteria bacterium]